MREIAGPHGHLYYLLDPLDEPKAPCEKSSSPEAPPLPNHWPRSLSPVHRSSSNTMSCPSSEQLSRSPMRPKSHTFTAATDHR